MLSLIIKGDEIFDEVEQTFSTVGDVTIELEHSLVSLSKWESEHQKPFLSGGSKTAEEVFDYIKAMVLTPNVDDDVFDRLTQENVIEIQNYIDSSRSATTFGVMPEQKGPGETITSELIYYWMVAFNIPFECESWHLNRLFSLVRICNIKNQPPKKLSRHEIAQRNRELNEQRKAQLNTNG